MRISFNFSLYLLNFMRLVSFFVELLDLIVLNWLDCLLVIKLITWIERNAIHRNHKRYITYNATYNKILGTMFIYFPNAPNVWKMYRLYYTHVWYFTKIRNTSVLSFSNSWRRIIPRSREINWKIFSLIKIHWNSTKITFIATQNTLSRYFYKSSIGMFYNRNLIIDQVVTARL